MRSACSTCAGRPLPTRPATYLTRGGVVEDQPVAQGRITVGDVALPQLGQQGVGVTRLLDVVVLVVVVVVVEPDGGLGHVALLDGVAGSCSVVLPRHGCRRPFQHSAVLSGAGVCLRMDRTE